MEERGEQEIPRTGACGSHAWHRACRTRASLRRSSAVTSTARKQRKEKTGFVPRCCCPVGGTVIKTDGWHCKEIRNSAPEVKRNNKKEEDRDP